MMKTKEQILAKKMLKAINILGKYEKSLPSHPGFGFGSCSIDVNHVIEGVCTNGDPNRPRTTAHVLQSLDELREEHTEHMKAFKIFDKEIDKCLKACNDLKSRSKE